jgi:putative endonuclease
MACFYVYVLQSEVTGRYYIGSAANLDQRILRHNAGRMQSTRHSTPWQLVYSEPFHTLAEARRRELQIKSWKNPIYMRRALNIAD